MDEKSRLSIRRKELGLTLEEVGKIVGVSKSTVRKWETGYIDNMKSDKIALLAKALKVSPLFVLGIEKENVIFDTPSEKSIGERIKYLRLKNNFTLEELGQKINTSKQTLYKYENGIVTNIPSDKIEKLAEIYNVSPADLMGWTENLSAQTNENQPNIQNKLSSILSELRPESGITLKNGEKTMTDSEKEILRISLENIIRLAKQMEK